MRKLIAIMALLCGAASAYAAEPQKWCSDSYDKPAELIMPSDGPFVFKVGGKTENLFDDDYVLTEDSFIYATIEFASEGFEYKKDALIFGWAGAKVEE